MDPKQKNPYFYSSTRKLKLDSRVTLREGAGTLREEGVHFLVSSLYFGVATNLYFSVIGSTVAEKPQVKVRSLEIQFVSKDIKIVVSMD